MFSHGRPTLVAAAFDVGAGRRQWQSGALSTANTWPVAATATGDRVMVGATAQTPSSAFLVYALHN